MGYRRSPADREHNRAWKRFTSSSSALMAATGVPTSLLAEQRTFEYFLMHGSRPTTVWYSVERLNRQQQESPVALVEACFQAGNKDTCVLCIDLAHLLKFRYRYPQCFARNRALQRKQR